jgi:hypothetical protein
MFAIMPKVVLSGNGSKKIKTSCVLRMSWLFYLRMMSTITFSGIILASNGKIGII